MIGQLVQIFFLMNAMIKKMQTNQPHHRLKLIIVMKLYRKNNLNILQKQIKH